MHYSLDRREIGKRPIKGQQDKVGQFDVISYVDMAWTELCIVVDMMLRGAY